MGSFSIQTITALIEIVTGGSGLGDRRGRIGIYRTGPQLEQFLGTAGIELYIGNNSRIPSVRIVVANANENDHDAVVRLIEQVADPREYLGRPEKLKAVVEYLNTRLQGDNYKLIQIDEAFKLRPFSSTEAKSPAAEEKFKTPNSSNEKYHPLEKLGETGQGNKDAKNEGEGGFIDNTKPAIKKLLSKNFIKATIKHLPCCGSYLFDIIYGVDGMKEQKEKIDLSIIAKNNIDETTPKPKKEKSGWGKKIGVGLLLIVPILAFLFGDNILGRISKEFKSNKPAAKQIETLDVPDDLVDVNGVVFEARPTADEIIEEIERLPVYEQKVATENYIGRTFKWRLRFEFLEHEKDGMVYVLCKASPVRGEVSFNINPDIKENLKIKKTKKGKFLDVSGEIMGILLGREPRIRLKDVRLEFVD